MKLAIDPENIKCTEVDELADDELMDNIMQTLKLSEEHRPALKETLDKMYHEFLFGFYDVRDTPPEHEQAAALKHVADTAYELIEALNKLVFYGDTDKRLATALKKLEAEGILKTPSEKTDPNNPNFHLREALGSLYAAADFAADLPNKRKSIAELEAKLKRERNPDKREDIEGEIALEGFFSHINPNSDEERRQRIAARKTPKDLPLRRSIEILREFFDRHVDYPFTAGKYYPEISDGFKSPAFRAVKIILEKIYPQVSARKIAGLMQQSPAA